jgi:uncharacterized OsmC-like protein
MSTPAGKFSLRVEQVDGYEFRVRFDKEHYDDLRMDEPPPLGRDVAPNPARILAASIADCLSASLVFCMKKARVPIHGFVTELDVELVRNDRGRLRIGSVDVRLHPTVEAGTEGFEKCLEAFEDFCVVTQSVREGLAVHVKVEPKFIPAST